MEPTGGTTRTGEAIIHAVKEFNNRKHGARKWARKFIVVFTDGYSQVSKSSFDIAYVEHRTRISNGNIPYSSLKRQQCLAALCKARSRRVE